MIKILSTFPDSTASITVVSGPFYFNGEFRDWAYVGSDLCTVGIGTEGVGFKPKPK